MLSLSSKMVNLPEKYHEQFIRVQQQYNEWTPFEQLHATIEITRTFQLSYRYFLSQLFQTNIQHENNDIFNHTVDNANAPNIIACLLKDSLDKIIFTIQLYLPLISNKTLNENLLDAYRDVLIHLDGNLSTPTKFSKSEQQLINFCQQILFFIQTNPNLHILLPHIPQLINLVKTNKFPIDEPSQQYHQPLQRYSSTRSQQTSIQSLMNFSSEGSQTCQPITRYVPVTPHDSGVDLSESGPTNSSQHFLSSHSFAARSHSNKHSFVAKTASSPIPEHTTTGQTHVPLKGVLSAPVSSAYSSYQQQKHKTILTKSDEEELGSQETLYHNNNNIQSTHTQVEDFILDNQSTNDTSKPLGQFYSFRQRPTKSNQNTEDVSQYLGVDANIAPTQNTFIQPNTGMKDVPKWLKHLRLHKYDVFFSRMSYDEMMNLTTEELKKFNVTDGACTKILLNIKKLKERSALLKQLLIDIDNGQIDLQNIIQQVYEILSTPIRSKQLNNDKDTEEDLPKLIIQILEKVYQQLTPKSSSDICNNLLGLFDRCYRHEAFTDEQRLSILQRRRRLSDMLQALGKIEYRAIQSPFNNNATSARRLNKPLVRNMKSTSSAFHPNYSTPLTKYNSEPQNNNLIESNIIRRPNRSPTFVYEESNDTNNSNLHHHLSFNCMTSTPQRNNGAYLANNQHQALTRKASIDPYGENQHNNNNNNNNNKIKLCKTFSEPSKIRFYNPPNLSNMPLPSTRPQQNSFRMISTPYSQQQQRQFISRSPPTSTLDPSSSSPIKKCYSDNERTDYYADNNDTALSSNDIENGDDQRHNNTEYEFFRQITEHAISDDVNESSIDHEDISDVKPSSNNSTDTEQ